MNTSNTLFIMLCTLLVLLMTPALAMFYSGMVRSKNTLNTIMNCFIVFGVISIQWVILGFSLAFSNNSINGIVGDLSNFTLNGISGYNDAGVPNILFVLFQMMFALISSAIITGSLVERIKFGIIVVFLVFWSTFVYDVLAHMIWHKDGFLLTRGGLDFAGGGVVHISSSIAGLVGVLMVGSRNIDKTHENVAHSIPYTFLGATLLFIGWLGFNSGSAGKVDDIAVIAFVNTILSASSGYLVWVMAEWIKHKKPSILGSLSGLVAGLVSITPNCAYVNILHAIIIGAIGAILCFIGLSIIKYRLKFDDTLDVFSLHGIGGIWGALAVGFFANADINPAATGEGTLGEGIFVGGSFHLLLEQIFTIFVCIFLSAFVSFIIFKIISFFTDLRVNESIEKEGLDILHGEKAYQ